MMIMLVLLMMMTRGIQEERVLIERPLLVHLVTTTRPLLQPLKISVVPFFLMKNNAQYSLSQIAINVVFVLVYVLFKNVMEKQSSYIQPS